MASTMATAMSTMTHAAAMGPSSRSRMTVLPPDWRARRVWIDVVIARYWPGTLATHVGCSALIALSDLALRCSSNCYRYFFIAEFFASFLRLFYGCFCSCLCSCFRHHFCCRFCCVFLLLIFVANFCCYFFLQIFIVTFAAASFDSSVAGFF